MASSTTRSFSHLPPYHQPPPPLTQIPNHHTQPLPQIPHRLIRTRQGLPIIVAEFLFLMFVLDKVYYSPLDNLMDDCNTMTKKMLTEVQGSSDEVKQLEDQANANRYAARAEVASTVEVEKMLDVGRTKVEGGLKEALENLERQKEVTIKVMDSQANVLSENIVKIMLPHHRLDSMVD